MVLELLWYLGYKSRVYITSPISYGGISYGGLSMPKIEQPHFEVDHLLFADVVGIAYPGVIFFSCNKKKILCLIRAIFINK